ncbi:MAG: Fic family protein [Solirubrobacteraceae bacterium MAG38_C4-C5]|nr:Fic family protein [Candidatus Siliceabacter maunaloa]
MAGAWLGKLRRQWRASSAESSIEIEGFHVPEEEMLAVASGDQSPDPDDDDRMALSCYARAMDHVGVMSDDPVFRWVDRVILDLHFDACYFQKHREPGLYRRRGIEVTSPRGGPPAYVGPPHDEVPTLMDEVVDWLDHGDLDAPVAVRAAMAHLHVVSVRPFRDGNGRISRIVQSLVLAREGLLAPEFVSIEEYLGRNTEAYYATLQKVHGGAYQPERDAAPLGAALRPGPHRTGPTPARADCRGRCPMVLPRGARRAAQLARPARHRPRAGPLPRGRRASYAAEADVSAPTASNDFRRLVDTGLIVQRGKGRTTRYVASESLRNDVVRRLGEGRRGQDGAD